MSFPHFRRHVQAALTGVNLRKPLLQGYLYKQGAHIGFTHRYFVLYKKVLVYYDHENDFKRDLIAGSLQHRDKAIYLEDVYLSKPEKKPKGAKYCFIIHVPNQKNERHDMLLVTKTRDERQKWMDLIQDQNPKLVVPSAHSTRVSASSPVPPRKRVNADTIREEKKTEQAQTHTQTPVNTSKAGVEVVIDHAETEECSSNGGIPGNGQAEDRLGEEGSYLDLTQLDIRDGPSDVEDNSD